MDVSNLTLEESQEKMDVSNLTLEELKGEEETVTLALNEIPVLHEQIQSLQERIRVLQEQRQPLQEKIQLLQKIRLILLEAKKEAQILRNPRRWTVAKKIEALGLSLAQPVGGTNPKKSGPDKELNANDRFYLQIADFFVHNTHLQEVITGILDPEGGILSVDAEDLRNSRYWQHFSDHFPVGAVYATGKLSPANRQAMVRNNPQQARELANVSNINRFARLHRTRLLNKANLSEEAWEKLPSHPGFLSEWKTFLHEPGFSESEQAHLWEKLHSLTTLPEEKRKDGWRELKAALNDLRSLSDKEREDAALQYLRQYLQQCRPLPSEHGNQLESIDDYIEEIQAHEIQSNVSEARRLFVTRPEDFEPDYRRSPLEAEEVSTTTTTTTITTNQPPVVIPFAARTNQGSHYASNSPVLSGSASQTSQYNPYQSLYETKIRSTGTAQTTRPPVNKASLDSLLNPDSTTPPRMTSMSFNSPTIPDSRFYTSSLSPYHHVPGQQTSFNPTPNSYQTSSYASQQAFPNLTVNTRSTRSFSDFSSDFQALAKPNLHLSQTPTLFSSQPPHNPDFNTPSITIPTLSFSGQTPLGNYGPHPYQMWSPLSSSGVQTPLKKMAPYGNPGVLSQEKVASIQVDDLVSYKPPGANLAPGKSVIAQVIHLAHGKAWISVLSSEELYEVNVAELTPVSSATTWEDF
jgi:hypothetical protein